VATLMGAFAFPVVLAASLLGEWIVNPSAELWEGVIQGLLFAGIYAAVGIVFVRLTAADRPGSVPYLLKLLLLACLASIGFGILLAVSISWLRRIPFPQTLYAIVTSATGDLIATITIVPLYIVWQMTPPLRQLDWCTYRILGASFIAVALASVVVFGLDSTDQFKFFY